MSTTIRVSHETRARLAALASTSGETMTSVVDEAVAALERQRFFDAFNAGYAALRSDSGTWTEVEQERSIESTALRDDG